MPSPIVCFLSPRATAHDFWTNPRLCVCVARISPTPLAAPRSSCRVVVYEAESCPRGSAPALACSEPRLLEWLMFIPHVVLQLLPNQKPSLTTVRPKHRFFAAASASSTSFLHARETPPHTPPLSAPYTTTTRRHVQQRRSGYPVRSLRRHLLRRRVPAVRRRRMRHRLGISRARKERLLQQRHPRRRQ